MDENKNLTPDNNEEENNIPEEVTEEIAEETEAASEEAVEEISDEVTEEAVEEVAEEESIVIPEETEEIKEEKKSKGGLIAALIGAVVLIALILSAVFLGGSPKNGTVNPGYATIKGNSVYHISYTDYKLHKTPVKGGEDVALTEEPTMYILGDNNDIYYLTFSVEEDGQTTVYKFKKFVDGVNDPVIVADEMVSPQISGGYVYYFKAVPEFYSGYSSRVYRAKLKENSQPELVCDCLSLSFYVDGKDLYFCDVETTSLMKVKISDAMSYIAENPLEDGGRRASSELSAQLIVEGVVTYPTVVGKKLYFIDAQNNYELCVCDLKTGVVEGFNNGVFSNNFNIYGDHIYYYSVSDYSFYRMKLDGSDVNKITGVNYYGISTISHDKIIFFEISDEGIPYLSVCDLDGNEISDISIVTDEPEEYYDDSAVELPEEDVAEEIEIVTDDELN